MIQLFGSILEDDEYGFLFAPEDDESRAFWISDNVGHWEPDRDGSRQGVAHFPYWIARKRRVLGPELEDENPAWAAIANYYPYFRAKKIRIKNSKNSGGKRA